MDDRRHSVRSAAGHGDFFCSGGLRPPRLRHTFSCWLRSRAVALAGLCAWRSLTLRPPLHPMERGQWGEAWTKTRTKVCMALARWQPKDNHALVLPDTHASAVEVLSQTGIVIQPPKRGPGDNDMARPCPAQALQLPQGRRVIGRRPPVLAVVLQERQHTVTPKRARLVVPLALVHQDESGSDWNRFPDFLNRLFQLLRPASGLGQAVAGRGHSRACALSFAQLDFLFKAHQRRAKLFGRDEQLLLQAVNFFRQHERRALQPRLGVQRAVIVDPYVLRGFPAPLLAPVNVDEVLRDCG